MPPGIEVRAAESAARGEGAHALAAARAMIGVGTEAHDYAAAPFGEGARLSLSCAEASGITANHAPLLRVLACPRVVHRGHDERPRGSGCRVAAMRGSSVSPGPVRGARSS